MITASKQEWTYSVLRGRIVNGTYAEGHRLVIDTIARELEVSPMPVREAIRRLEAEGWVHYERNHGASVRPLDDDTWAEGMTAVGVLDGYVTAIAAPHLTAADFDGLREANERMRAALDELDPERVSEANLDLPPGDPGPLPQLVPAAAPALDAGAAEHAARANLHAHPRRAGASPPTSTRR